MSRGDADANRRRTCDADASFTYKAAQVRLVDEVPDLTHTLLPDEHMHKHNNAREHAFQGRTDKLTEGRSLGVKDAPGDKEPRRRAILCRHTGWS